MSYRNYNSLDRFRSDRNDDGEFDDFGFDRRRYGSGRYVRNDLDGSATLTMKRDNPDLVQFGNNAVPNCTKFQNCPPSYAPSNQQTKEMIGSYGIYCRRSGSGGAPPGMGNCEDDGGFSQDDSKPNSGYYSERMVVVNSARNGTTTNTIVEPDTTGKADDKFQWCCFNDTTGTEKIPSERNSHWYKSSVLLLLFAVVLAVVVLVSGLWLYFKYANYVTYKPRELLTEDRLGTVKKQYADRVGGLVESDGSSDPQKDQPEKKENSSHSRKRKSPFKNSLPSSRGKLMTANCLLPPKLSAKKMTKLSKSTASKNGTFISSKKNRPTVQSATRNLMNLLDDTPTQATSTSEPQTRNSVHDLYDDTHMQGTTSESQKQNSMHGVLNDTPIRSSTRISEYLNDEKSVTKAIRDARHALHGTPFQPEDFLITGPQYENHSLDRTPNYQSENGYANDYNEEQGFHALENSIENLDKQNNSNIVPKDVDATPETVQPHKDDSEQKLKRICNNPISAIQNKLKVGEDPSPTDIGLALVGIHRQNVRTQVLLANLIKIVNSSSDNQQPTIVQPDYGKQFPFTTLQDFEAFNSLLSDSAEKKKFSAYVTAMFSNLNKNNAQSTVYDTTKALFNDFIFEHYQWSSRKSKNEELLNNRLLVFKTTTFAECFFAPCERKYCAYDAVCVLEPNGRPVCRCPSDCPLTESPVCGTDGVTYKNLCTLRSTACQNKLNIRVQHGGECHLSDPCRHHVCQYGARCVPAPDGRNVTCECPLSCPNYGDHSRSRPVCGADGLDYTNHCELKKTACTSSVNITVKYEGYCDPCSRPDVKCSEPEVCQLDPDRNPVCRCSETCSLEFAPVCGSDGKTYSNECSLRQQSCRSRKNLRIIYRGKCGSGVNPCSNVKCKSNEECIINKYGIAACECISDCEPIIRPVCGLDGVTYDSFCHLQQSSCQLKSNVTLAYNGVCGEHGACSNHHCDHGAQCVQRNGRASCECPVCTNEFDPVCGSDGISYGNLCKLQYEECQHQRTILVLYKGLCNGCENKKCEIYSTCESDGAGEAKCVCPSQCPEEKNTVCGSDSNTYTNECELKKHSCEIKELITISYKGNCDICQGVKCTNRTRCESGVCVCPSDCDKDLSVSIIEEPVCASDMNTYPNECEMQKHACIHSLATLSVLFYGDCKERIDASLLLEPMKETDPADLGNHLVNVPVDKKEVCQDILCDYEATCEPNPEGGPRCSCIFDCSREPEKPVCGSDFQMYSSLCHMKMKSCQKQEEIRLRPIDLCQGMAVKPCNGKNPILDPVSGIELDCGSGPNRKDCPSDSYCHHTSKFARCCAKDTGIYIKSCHDSWYGCCPDDKTPAQGPDNAGCPSMCNCNKLGSYSDACEPESGQCKCKPGVGGLKCDRCEPGFWGLPKISNSHPGCLPCGCSLFGSVRDDCEQMTGRCVCKPEVQGSKCTICTDLTKVLGPNGCVSADVSTPSPTSCNDLSCYFGATCEIHSGLAKCVCHITCPQDYNSQSQVVCGNDGQTYSSECQLKLYSCRYQKDIAVQALSSCTDDYISGTDGPKLGAWTSINQFTEPEEVAAPLSKSTRHVLSTDPKNTASFTPKLANKSTSQRGDVDYNEINSDMYHVINEPTSATMIIMIGDACVGSEDCMIENSHCVAGVCVCREPYLESADKQSCSEGITLAVKQRACLSNPCKNNAHCRDKSDVEFECVCLFPYTGPLCENSLVKREIDMPAFSGQSYIELKQLKAYHKFSVEIEFKTYTDNGILLYSQQRSDGAGDFISLAIVNGYAEFRYNLGNGPAILTSMQRLSLNNFHKIVAKRYQRDGILQVDNNESVAGQSEGTLKALDLYDSAYIGYVPISSNKVFENIGTSAGFVGCVKKLKIGRHIVKLKDKHDSIVQKVHDIKECTDLVKCENNTNLCNCIGGICEVENNPCNLNPCQYGSICEPLLQGSYMCNCLPGYKSNSCEIFEPVADDLYIAQFNGMNSYIKFPCLENVRRGFSIEIWFLATSMNGVLLYNGQLHNRRGDFISVNLVNGFVQFRYDLGSGIANITTENQIDLNAWQTVKIHRFDRVGSIQLNNGTISKGMSGPSLNELNLELPLYVGGVPTLSEVSRESGIHDKFAGAIQRMLINGKSLQLLSGEHINVVPYKSHVCSNDDACLNGGICVPYLSTFYCKCLVNFSGTHCQNYSVTDNEVAVHFNGNMFLQYRHSNKHSYPELHVNFINNTLIGDGLTVDEAIMEPGSLDNIEDDNSDSDYDDDMYDDTSDFEFFNDEKKTKKIIQYEFAIRTTQTSGLLLWNSKIRHSQRDYVAISIVDGFIEFYHFFGKEQQVVALISEEMISDGKWHSVWIQHRKRITQIRIDSNKPAKLHSSNVQKIYLSNGKVFIGGVANLPSNYPAKYSIGFRGCLKNLLIDRKRASLAQLSHNTSTHIEYCQDNDI